MKNFISKKYVSLAILTLSTSMALAQGYNNKVTITCPLIANKGTNIVTNYGMSLLGIGTLRINSGNVYQEPFQGPVVQGANIPMNLVNGGYQNNGVTYSPSNGVVICYYNSVRGYDPFLIKYWARNSLNGTVTSADNSEIHLVIPAVTTT